MTEVHLFRRVYMEDRTLGDIIVLKDNRHVYECKALELPWRDNKPRISCIPAGRYRMEWRWSPRANRNLWWLENVPGRMAIQWHAANWPKELLGCIAPCTHFADLDGDGIVDGANTRKALAALEQALDGAIPVTVVHGDGRDVWPPVK